MKCSIPGYGIVHDDESEPHNPETSELTTIEQHEAAKIDPTNASRIILDSPGSLPVATNAALAEMTKDPEVIAEGLDQPITQAELS